jgi:hypothetical protein
VSYGGPVGRAFVSKVAVKQLALTKLVKHPVINYPMSHMLFMANNILMMISTQQLNFSL